MAPSIFSAYRQLLRCANSMLLQYENSGVLTRTSNRCRYHQHERSTDFPARAVRFPETADLANVKASYVNGVLKLEVRSRARPSSGPAHRVCLCPGLTASSCCTVPCGASYHGRNLMLLLVPARHLQDTSVCSSCLSMRARDFYVTRAWVTLTPCPPTCAGAEAARQGAAADCHRVKTIRVLTTGEGTPLNSELSSERLQIDSGHM